MSVEHMQSRMSDGGVFTTLDVTSIELAGTELGDSERVAFALAARAGFLAYGVPRNQWLGRMVRTLSKLHPGLDENTLSRIEKADEDVPFNLARDVFIFCATGWASGTLKDHLQYSKKEWDSMEDDRLKKILEPSVEFVEKRVPKKEHLS